MLFQQRNMFQFPPCFLVLWFFDKKCGQQNNEITEEA